MMMPEDALKSPGGYAYIVLVKGNGTKPAHTAAVNVRLRVRSVDGNIVDEDTGTIAVAHSTPFLEEMIGLMEIGETIRVWGESQARIWEIELLSVDTTYDAPEDAAAPPANASSLPEFDDVHYRVIEPGNGNTIEPGQVVRFHATRWKSDGEILESTKAGRGMLLMLNEAQKQLDPVHHAMILQMQPGMHVRLWLPKERIHSNSDIVEDLWVVERINELEPPQNCTVPDDKSNLIEVTPDVWMQKLNASSEPQMLHESDAVTVDLTCWRADNGELIEASYMREKHDIMDIKPELGVWFDIMQKAAPGDTFITWIPAKALPDSVHLDMVCRVTIFERINK